jgi:hypothetical protein
MNAGVFYSVFENHSESWNESECAVLRTLANEAREKLQSAALTIALRQIRRSAQPVLSEPLFDLLAWGWGNRAWIAEIEYLRAIFAHARATTGSILECGSGLSTLVTGALIDGGDTILYALEHDPVWYEKARATVARFRLSNVRPLLTPLEDFGEFCWYGLKETDLPHDISLVLCDGPPAKTKGGRYGLLPILRPRLSPGALILVDDYKRSDEKGIVERWLNEFGGSVTVMGTQYPYALVNMQPARENDSATRP